MVKVSFTPNLARHVDTPICDVAGGTVREALDRVFAGNPRLRGYVLDDQGAVRRHMSVFIDGHHLKDRAGLSDPIDPETHIYVAQALSGG